MRKRKNKKLYIEMPHQNPTKREIGRELRRVRTNEAHRSSVRNTWYLLLAVAAVTVLVATLVLPIMKIYGNSMSPTLNEREIVVSVKGSELEQGDIVAFYYNNKILIKRVIAFSGQWVDIDKQGNVSVDGKVIEEPYLKEKAYGDCDLKLPFQVPEGRIFVMGDHRKTAMDSRMRAIGPVSEEQIVGKIVFRIWPLYKMGTVQ